MSPISAASRTGQEFSCQARVHGSRRGESGRSSMRAVVAIILYLLLAFAAPLQAADRLESTPRIAVISAFEPEWKALKASLGEAKSHQANGVEFVTGTLSGRQVVLFLSGVSMVN